VQAREWNKKFEGTIFLTPHSAFALYSPALKWIGASACSAFSESAALCAIASQLVSPDFHSVGVKYQFPNLTTGSRALKECSEWKSLQTPLGAGQVEKCSQPRASSVSLPCLAIKTVRALPVLLRTTFPIRVTGTPAMLRGTRAFGAAVKSNS